MSDKKLTQREKDLIAEARAELLTAQILEEGFFGDLISGISRLFTDPGSIAKLITGADLGGLNIGDEKAVQAFSDKAAFLPRQTEELKKFSNEALDIILKATIESNWDQDVNVFFKMAVESSARAIAKAQEKEIKEITSAITKRIKDDKAAQLYAGIIIPASLLGALKTNLK